MEHGVQGQLKSVLPKSIHASIETLLSAGEKKSFRDKGILVYPGDPIVSLTIVLSGRISIHRVSTDGKRQLMYFLKPGDLCGVSVNSAPQKEVSKILAVADTDSEIFCMPGGLLRELMLSHPGWFEFANYAVAKNMEDSMKCLDSVTFTPLAERLENYLNDYASLLGSHEIVKSHLQIAEDLNSSREVVSRLLKKMEINETVELRHGRILMKDAPVLG